MANQYLKLRRSSLPGKIPDTASLDFGEIALNTFDGRAFMKKSSSLGEEVIIIGSTQGAFTGSFSGSFTGSLFGTASWAQNFSGSVTSASYAYTASSAISSSYASSSTSASYAITASYFSGTVLSASYASSSTSASYASSATSASYASSSTSASFATTASYVITAQTASYFNGTVISASYASSSTSASYAQTASNILGGATNYIPLWNSATTLSSSVIYQSSSNIGIGTTTPNAKLHVSGTIGNIFQVDGFNAATSNSLYVSASGYVALGKTLAGKQIITIDGNSISPGTLSKFSGSYNLTGSVSINSNVIISGSLTVSGSLLPIPAGATVTSSISHSLGNPKAVWYKLYISRNSIVFVDNTTETQYDLGVNDSGSLTYNGVPIATISGSLISASYASSSTSASFATTASYFGGSVTSASYASSSTSASFASTAASAPLYVLTSATSSMLSPYVQNSQTSSFVTNAQTSSFATTGSNTFKANQTITGSLTVTGSTIITGSLNVTQGITGSLFGTASWAQNALTASFLIGFNPYQIATGSVTASVDVNPNSIFLIKSGSVNFLNISSSGNTTLSSNLFIVKSLTTQQPVLTVSQSIVNIATQSFNPTGTTDAGSIWFTSTAMYIGLE